MQYLYWLKAMLHLDFGVSFASGYSVLSEIGARIGITLAMNIAAMVLIFYLSLRFGIRSALNGGRTENAIKQLSL